MIKFLQDVAKLVMALIIIGGAFLLFKNYGDFFSDDPSKKSGNNAAIKDGVASDSDKDSDHGSDPLNPRSEALRKYLLANDRPQRIEIVGLTRRFEKEVENIQKLKIPHKKDSNFYILIQFFTDEEDAKAPLVAQVRFIDIASGNILKEESLNLE